MRPVKAVIFDIDDTIFDMKTKTFISSSIEAIKQLQNKGIVVILATGRPPKTAKAIESEGVKVGYTVCTNGSIIMDGQNNILLSRTFSKQLSEKIYQYCKTNDIGLLFKFPEKIYEYIHKDVFENFYNKTPTSRNNIVFGKDDAHLYDCPNGGCLGADRKTTELFNEAFKNECRAVMIDDLSSDLILNGVSKMTGVQWVLDKLGIDPSECMSFGDNDNDIEINNFVATGVAVGNCSENLRKEADYITDSINDDGVLKALKHFELI